MQILKGPPSVGDIIRELYLIPANLSPEEAAKLCDISFPLFDQILQGDHIIGYELAFKLGKGFNTSHNFWMGIQKDFTAAEDA